MITSLFKLDNLFYIFFKNNFFKNKTCFLTIKGINFNIFYLLSTIFLLFYIFIIYKITFALLCYMLYFDSFKIIYLFIYNFLTLFFSPNLCLYIIFTKGISFIIKILILIPILLLILNIFLAFYLKTEKIFTLFLSILKFNFSLYLFFLISKFEITTQYLLFKNWIEFFNLNFSLGIDSISLSFILLSDLLNLICILLLWSSIKYKQNLYKIILLLCNLILTMIFYSVDLFIFYIFFELILIPMFFLITAWGSRLRKIHATLQFFLYTLIGSLIFLAGLIYLTINYGTTDLIILQYLIISNNDQIFLWLAFFLAFAIKVPIYPFHLWLPEAHVEAPTTGSVLLAGILLKLGTYGFLKFFFILLPYSSIYFLPLINMLCCLGILYSSFAIIRQIDIKKIIAYSSVIHMNYTILGLFNTNFLSFYGSFYLMLSHGIVSSALFICVGFIYERYHTRIIYYYGNLVMIMPLITIFFFLFTLGNIGFPGTSSFIGEFLIFIGIFQINPFIGTITLFALFISVIYSFLLFNKIFFYNSFGSINTSKTYIIKYSDINKREFFILFILAIFMFFYGIYTKSLSDNLYYNLNDLFFNNKYKL